MSTGVSIGRRFPGPLADRRVARAPHVVLDKERLGDRSVRLRLPALSRWRGTTPVLIDDTVSSAGTLICAVEALTASGLPMPVCVAIHAMFAENASESLRRAGAQRIVSCDTVPHPTSAIFLAPLIGAAVSPALAKRAKAASSGRQLASPGDKRASS